MRSSPIPPTASTSTPPETRRSSTPYHQFIVKYARHLGLAVEHDHPATMLPWQIEALFNSYLRKLLAREDIPQDAFEFDWEKDDWGKLNVVVVDPKARGRKGVPRFPGIIQIRR
jgi:hypothetical protein